MVVKSGVEIRASRGCCKHAYTSGLCGGQKARPLQTMILPYLWFRKSLKTFNPLLNTSDLHDLNFIMTLPTA